MVANFFLIIVFISVSFIGGVPFLTVNARKEKKYISNSVTVEYLKFVENNYLVDLLYSSKFRKSS